LHKLTFGRNSEGGLGGRRKVDYDFQDRIDIFGLPVADTGCRSLVHDVKKYPRLLRTGKGKELLGEFGAEDETASTRGWGRSRRRNHGKSGSKVGHFE
jgi:hypothetical protein